MNIDFSNPCEEIALMIYRYLKYRSHMKLSLVNKFWRSFVFRQFIHKSCSIPNVMHCVKCLRNCRKPHKHTYTAKYQTRKFGCCEFYFCKHTKTCPFCNVKKEIESTTSFCSKIDFSESCFFGNKLYLLFNDNE